MVKLAKRKSGINIIQKNINKFQSIISGLDEGIGLCVDEQVSNDKTIKALEVKNQTIQGSKDQAVIFRNNLSNMLENPTSDETANETAEVEEKKED